jgi:four helix bundle protein
VGARRVEDLVAFQWAAELKQEVYRLFGESAAAAADFRYRDQVFAAVSSVESDIAEGFARWRPREFAQFLRYALASLAETRVRLRDGVHRGHFTEAALVRALFCARQCDRACQEFCV